MSDLVIAYLHDGNVAHSFHHSMRALQVHDLTHEQRLAGFISQQCGAGRITDGRNDAVRRFLKSNAEWLAFVDADMGFEADAFDQLLAVADPVERPIVGGLAFGQRRGAVGPAGSLRTEQFPTIYRWVDGGGVEGCAPVYEYPPNALVECDATGAAFFIVHRDVLFKLAETYPQPRAWFDEELIKGQVFGEDLTFFRRCTRLGYPVYVHTGVKTSHYKSVYLTEDTQHSLEDIPNYVVIPQKDQWHLTRNLIDKLAIQNEYERIFIFDNGSSEDTRLQMNDYPLPPRVEVIEADGWNIHQMWNAGINRANAMAWPANIAILNNDIEIGENFLSGLALALRRDPLLAAVCPNYDGRSVSGLDLNPVQYVTDICANRYDGSGGLAGFAFMIKSESGYRFPEDLRWWYGDNDMMAHIAYASGRAGIVIDTRVEHIDGGSQTADWDDPEMLEILERDQEWFEQKWSAIYA